MPSFVFGGRSGGDLIFSGNPFGGTAGPTGGIQLRSDRSSSGNLYVGLSGKVTVQSGGFFQSGGGLLDGMQIGPGDSYFIPRQGTGFSGMLNIYVAGDLPSSGFARLYWEIY